MHIRFRPSQYSTATPQARLTAQPAMSPSGLGGETKALFTDNTTPVLGGANFGSASSGAAALGLSEFLGGSSNGTSGQYAMLSDNDPFSNRRDPFHEMDRDRSRQARRATREANNRVGEANRRYGQNSRQYREAVRAAGEARGRQHSVDPGGRFDNDYNQ